MKLEINSRHTKQRDLIRRILTASDSPLSATDVYDRARMEMPTLGIATVYRTLNRLVAGGLLKEVQLPGRTVQYERTGLDHHYFECSRCSRIFSLSGCVRGLQHLAPANFDVRGHEVILYGFCSECRG